MARPSATCLSACDRFGERIDRAHMRAHPAADQVVAQFVLVAGELVGGHILKLEAQHRNALHQHQVQRDAGDDAGREPHRDEPPAAAQRPQRGFGQLTADRVDDRVGAVGQRLAQRIAQGRRPGG